MHQASQPGLMPRTRRVHHVSVLVTDLVTAEKFYAGVLGLRPLVRPGGPTRGLFFEVGDAQLHITLTDAVEPLSLRHTAYEVDDLESTLRDVVDMGLPVWDDTPLPGWVRKQCRDPSGNGVELLQRVKEGVA